MAETDTVMTIDMATIDMATIDMTTDTATGMGAERKAITARAGSMKEELDPNYFPPWSKGHVEHIGEYSLAKDMLHAELGTPLQRRKQVRSRPAHREETHWIGKKLSSPPWQANPATPAFSESLPPLPASRAPHELHVTNLYARVFPDHPGHARHRQYTSNVVHHDRSGQITSPSQDYERRNRGNVRNYMLESDEDREHIKDARIYIPTTALSVSDAPPSIGRNGGHIIRGTVASDETMEPRGITNPGAADLLPTQVRIVTDRHMDYTISKNNTKGEDKRQAALLAELGRRTYTRKQLAGQWQKIQTHLVPSSPLSTAIGQQQQRVQDSRAETWDGVPSRRKEVVEATFAVIGQELREERKSSFSIDGDVDVREAINWSSNNAIIPFETDESQPDYRPYVDRCTICDWRIPNRMKRRNQRLKQAIQKHIKRNHKSQDVWSDDLKDHIRKNHLEEFPSMYPDSGNKRRRISDTIV